jgi:hypothetical protein
MSVGEEDEGRGGDGDEVAVGASVDLMCVDAAVATPIGVRVGMIGSGVGVGRIVGGTCVGELLGGWVVCSPAEGRPTPSRAASMARTPILISKKPPQASSFLLLTPSPYEQQDHAD